MAQQGTTERTRRARGASISLYAQQKRDIAREAMRVQLEGMGLIAGIITHGDQLVSWAMDPEWEPSAARVAALSKKIDTNLRLLHKILPDLKETEHKGDAIFQVVVNRGTIDPQRLDAKAVPSLTLERIVDGDEEGGSSVAPKGG